MKNLILILTILLSLYSCKKEDVSPAVNTPIKDSISTPVVPVVQDSYYVMLEMQGNLYYGLGIAVFNTDHISHQVTLTKGDNYKSYCTFEIPKGTKRIEVYTGATYPYDDLNQRYTIKTKIINKASEELVHEDVQTVVVEYNFNYKFK